MRKDKGGAKGQHSVAEGSPGVSSGQPGLPYEVERVRRTESLLVAASVAIRC